MFTCVSLCHVSFVLLWWSHPLPLALSGVYKIFKPLEKVTQADVREVLVKSSPAGHACEGHAGHGPDGHGAEGHKSHAGHGGGGHESHGCCDGHSDSHEDGHTHGH